MALPWLSLELRQGAHPWLHPDAIARLTDDPLVIRKIKPGTYEGLVALVDAASKPPTTSLPPTLVLHGDLDTTILRGAIEDLVKALRPGVRLRTYAERHHRLLQEHDSEQVFADCLAWMNADRGSVAA